MKPLPTIQEATKKNSLERAACVDVAMRRKPADLVIQNGNLLSVRTGEILKVWGVAVVGRRVAAIGNIEDCIGPQTQIIDAEGMHLIPGFCDGHLHIESSRLTAAGYASVALPGGTTSVMEDPHEICNVIGLDGIRYFLEAGSDLPMKIWPQVSSAVPPSDYETSGGDIGPEEADEAFHWPGVVGIGEVMTIQEVLDNQPRIRGIIDKGLEHRQPVEGHAASLRGRYVDAYASAGIGSDHETQPADVLDKIRRGIAVQLRTANWWEESFKRMIESILELNLDTRSVMVVTDDRHAGDLLALGSMDFNVRTAIQCGVPPIQAVQLATINPAMHFGLEQEIGEITPGRLADILLVPDLQEMRIAATIASGKIVARDGKLLINLLTSDIPSYASQSIHFPRLIRAEDFVIAGPVGKQMVDVRLTSYSRPSGTAKLAIINGEVQRDRDQDVTKISVIDRHSGTMRKGVGFVRGLGFCHGAVASTIAHDAHNLIVIGGSDEEMALAANRLTKIDGGIIVVRGDAVLAELALPVAGLMSPLPPAEVAGRLDELDRAAKSIGAADWLGSSPTMILTYLTLSAAQPLLITDFGLVDVEKNSLVPLFAES